MPITTKLVGGLGNQLFQIANCIAYSLRYGQEYQIPQALDTGYNKYAVYFHHLPPLTTDINNFGTYREPESLAYCEIPKKEQICMIGYFQSWKYFEDRKREVFNIILDGFEKYRQMFEANHTPLRLNDAAIHVRRGDYASDYSDTHPPVTMEYLKKGIYFLYEKGVRVFTIYSDDLNWCRETLPKGCFFVAHDAVFRYSDELLTGRPGKMDETENVLCDFYNMKMHAHQIISNSTFSLWAAMLNDNPDKIVVCPDESNWFGKSAPYDAKDIIPTNFHRIKY